MQFFVVAVSIAAAVSGVVAAPAAVPVADAPLQKRDWCYDDGFNKAWSAKWNLCMQGNRGADPGPAGSTEGCSYNGQPVQSFQDGWNNAIRQKSDCKF